MFIYYSPHQQECRVTVVGEHKDGVLKLAVTRCSKKDRFVKKKGVAIAKSRLENNYLHSKYKLDSCSPKDFVETAVLIANEVCETKVVNNK